MPQHNKATYDKVIANITLGGENWKHFFWGQEQDRYSLLPLLFNIVLEILDTTTKEGKEKWIRIVKEIKL